MAKMGEFVSLGASNDQLKAKLRETTTLMVGSAAEWQKSLDGVGDHGKTAFARLEEGMKSFKREQVQQGKLVGFYMRELQEFIPLGGEAKNMVGGLAQVLVEGAAGGLSFGLAFEGLKLAATIIKSFADEGKRAIEAADKVVQPIMKQWEDRIAALNRSLVVLKGGAGAGIGYDLAQSRRELTLQIYELEKQKRAATLPSSAVDIQHRINELQKQLQDLAKRAASAIAKTEEEEAEKARQERAKADKEAAEKKQEAAIKAARERAQAETKAEADEYRRLLKSYMAGGSYLPAAALQESTNSAADQHGAYERLQLLGKNVAGKGMPYQGGKQSDADRNAVDAENLKITEEEIKKQQRLQEALQQTAQTWMSYGEQVGSVLGEMAAGTASWGDLFKEVLKQVMTALYQYAVSAIMKQAGVAAANTMEENSKAGPYGWIVGLGAMGAVFAAVMGLVGKIGTAEQGAELPAFSGTRMYGLHSEELVLPRYYRAGLKSLIDSQGSARNQPQRIVNNHFNINANDAKSFEDQINRGGWDRVLNRWAESQASR